jgi:hypothetical protein
VPPVAAALALKVIDPEVAFPEPTVTFASPVVAAVALTLPPVALTRIAPEVALPVAAALPVVALVVTLLLPEPRSSSP